MLVEQADGDVAVVVRDSGPGVAPEQVMEVFRQRVHHQGSPDGGYRGFGLALTRMICLRRGGR